MTELAQFSAEFAGIGDLLERQAARYRRAHGLGQGGSMTTELARELLASIQCTLALSPEAHGSLDRRLSDGQAVLLAKLEAARKRLALAAATAPDWQSEGREEEFSALENYLRRYDLYCLAHHVPEITVYPYLAPLPEDALGLDRAAGRLEMLWAENQIFALFPGIPFGAILGRFLRTGPGADRESLRGSPVPCRRSGGPWGPPACC